VSAPVALDYETFYSKRLKYSVKSMIAEQYCKHHLFDPYMVAVCDGKHEWSGHPRDLNWAALDGKIWLSHNRYFDNNVFNAQRVANQVPAVAATEWHCTANLTSFLCNRRSLDDAVEHLFKVRLDKTARSDANHKHWPNDFNDSEQARMLEYAKSDVRWCWKLWDTFGSKWPAHEQRISNFTINQGMQGVQINRDLLNNYIMQSHEMKSNTEKLLPWLLDEGDEVEDWGVDEPKPTSTKCIAEQCRRSGIPCPPVVSREGEEAFEEWQNTYGEKHKWIGALTAWRSINKVYKTFLLVKERLRPDGTMPFGSKYFGAHTGRVSGDARVNMYNMRKVPIFCNEHGLLEANERRCLTAVDYKKETGKWPEWVRFTIDFRNLVIPRPGKKMIVSDLSQIEPRVLAWLSGDTEMLSMLRSGMSIYEAHARTKMNWTGGNLKKENPGLYALAKANVLALGYGAGWEKYITMAYTLARVDITKDDPEWVEEIDPLTGEMTKVSGYGYHAKRTVTDFRASNPKTKGLWDSLDGAFKRSLGEDFIMTLPSGRKMIYEHVRAETRIVKNKKTGKPERSNQWMAGTGGRRVSYYGGKLTENITQAVSRDVFMWHTMNMEDLGWHSLFGVYDEAVLEVDNNINSKDVEREMSKTPEWLEGCPVSAEAHEVEHYCK